MERKCGEGGEESRMENSVGFGRELVKKALRGDEGWFKRGSVWELIR